VTVANILEAEDRLADSLAAHVGQWVAVKDHVVVETADTLKALLGKIVPNDVDRIFEITKDSEGIFLL
jgi:hypothetical protein